MNIIKIVLIILTWPLIAHSFETDTWLGEGIPVFSSKNSQLILHKNPSLNSPAKTFRFKVGSRIVYDKSKLITIQSALLKARKEIIINGCPSSPIKLKKGDKVEYMQYRAEGYGTVRIRNEICEVFIYEQHDKFDGLSKSPKIEWWIRVIDKNQEPWGWLLVDENQVNFLSRQF